MTFEFPPLRDGEINLEKQKCSHLKFSSPNKGNRNYFKLGDLNDVIITSLFILLCPFVLCPVSNVYADVIVVTGIAVFTVNFTSSETP